MASYNPLCVNSFITWHYQRGTDAVLSMPFPLVSECIMCSSMLTPQHELLLLVQCYWAVQLSVLVLHFQSNYCVLGVFSQPVKRQKHINWSYGSSAKHSAHLTWKINGSKIMNIRKNVGSVQRNSVSTYFLSEAMNTQLQFIYCIPFYQPQYTILTIHISPRTHG